MARRAVTDGSLKCTRATSVHNLKLSCHPLAKLYGAFIMFPATVTRKLLAVMSPTKIKKIYMYIGSLGYSVEASETSTPLCLLPSSSSSSLSLSLFLLLLEKGEEHARVPLKSVWNIIASTRVPVMEGFAFNFDNDRNRFRYPEKAGRNVALLSCAASRIRNLVNSPETVNSGTFDSDRLRCPKCKRHEESCVACLTQFPPEEAAIASAWLFNQGRILELHSPDGVHECWLRAADNTEANVWFNALHSALAALTLKALRLASALPDPQQLQHIGWLARRHCLQNGRASSESSEDGAGSSASTSRGAGSGFGLAAGCTGGWRSVFGAVSGRELRLYECAPWSPEAWASPSITCPLIATRMASFPPYFFPVYLLRRRRSATHFRSFPISISAYNRFQRLVLSGRLPTICPFYLFICTLERIAITATSSLVSSPTRQNEAASSSSGSTQHGATFAVRVGTMDGVVTHHLRAETRRDLAAWARAIVQGCHTAAHSLREYTVRCIWQGKACQLVVNHEEGFALYSAGTRGTAGNGVSPGSPPTPLWRRSFDKLKMSADDGARLLWLDFGGEDGEIELDLESCPKPIVFVLHNFLSAKIHRLGLSA
ncbi:Beta-1-syntrophin [Cyphomyrmex costatus]|uniref:Beta-1-syntrophin n=1 Tax=Cyphomyrmex costatus TaxID=456900 RepID=A0A195CW23_9HYME|nr:Beta-1-syntrophin [Cyphomyrmex costatus]